MTTTKTTPVFPLLDGETFIEWTERFLADAENRRNQDLYRRIDQCREADANTYAIEG